MYYCSPQWSHLINKWRKIKVFEGWKTKLTTILRPNRENIFKYKTVWGVIPCTVFLFIHKRYISYMVGFLSIIPIFLLCVWYVSWCNDEKCLFYISHIICKNIGITEIYQAHIKRISDNWNLAKILYFKRYKSKHRTEVESNK